MEEIWKQHPRYKGYTISNTGRVISNIYKSRNRELKTSIKCGRACVTIYFGDGGNIMTQISRLVAETFLEEFTPECKVLHLDNNPLNNIVSNLKCGTQKENIQQCISDGRYVKRVTNQEKLSNIKESLENGLGRREISDKYGYPYSTICDIIRRYKLNE